MALIWSNVTKALVDDADAVRHLRRSPHPPVGIVWVHKYTNIAAVAQLPTLGNKSALVFVIGGFADFDGLTVEHIGQLRD